MQTEFPTRDMYFRFTRLSELVRQSEILFLTMGDEKYLSRLKEMKQWLAECLEDMRLLERANLIRLEEAIAAGKMPYSVVTWYEDERDELWDNLG
jgi:hypothetical protein